MSAPSRCPVRADRPAQPQPRRDRQRHGHPDAPADVLHPQLVGLHVAQGELPLLDQVPMHLLAVGPGPRLPPRDGPLVQAERGDDGLQRAAVRQQRHHQGHRLGRRPQPVERRPRRRGERPPADRAAVAALEPAMHPDGGGADPAPGGAALTRAELGLRVHRHSAPDAIWPSRRTACAMDPHTSPWNPRFHGSVGRYHAVTVVHHSTLVKTVLRRSTRAPGALPRPLP
jgi:hypothetical protein